MESDRGLSIDSVRNFWAERIGFGLYLLSFEDKPTLF